MVNRVTGTGTGGVPASRAKPGSAASPTERFSIAGDAPGEIQQAAPAQNVTLSAMLSLQEAEGETIQDKTARRHGVALLAALSALHKGLLSRASDGAADGETEIASLVSLTIDMPQAADPGLAAVLASIRLRAKIELLRRGVQIS